MEPSDQRAEPRIRMPESLDLDSLRGCVDSALRLLGEDLCKRFGPAMEREYGHAWAREIAPVGHESIEKLDPAFWFRELSNSGSPARRTFPGWSPFSAQYLRDARRVRNRHCHFGSLGAGASPGSAAQDLALLGRVANALRLPSKSDITGLAQTVQHLESGTQPPALSMADAVKLGQDGQRVSDEVDDVSATLITLEEQVDRQNEEIGELQARLAITSEGAIEHARIQGELADAKAHVQRLQQEAEIAAAHRAELEQRSAEIAVRQLEQPPLPPVLGDALARLYAASIGVMEFKANLDFTEIARGVDLDNGQATLVASISELARSMSERARGTSEEMASISDELGVSRNHVESIPMTDTFPWIERQLAAYAELKATSALADELQSLDEDSRLALERWMALGEAFGTFLPTLGQIVEHMSMWATRQPAARAIEDGRRILPGEPWPFDRGNDTWVLSASRRSIRRLRGAGGLADALGKTREAELVDAFLEVRPEGGRVYVDHDGDACTLIGGQLVYLGLVGI